MRWLGDNKLTLRAAAKPVDTVFFADASPVEFELVQAAEGQPAKIKGFSTVAYTGGAMKPSNWPYREPLVVDLEGMAVPRQSIPVDAEHSTIVGHTDAIEKTPQRVKASGVLSAYSDTEQTPMAQAARETVRLAANGFPWQASMEFEASRLERIDPNQSVKVNGRNFQGPLFVARASVLRRISFVANGADSNTSAAIAASANKGGYLMSEQLRQWLQAKGIDTANVTDVMTPIFQAQYDVEHKPAETPPDVDAAIRAGRDAHAAESRRIAAIRAICAKYGRPDIQVDGKPVDCETHAITAGWSETETKAAVLDQELNRVRRAPAGIVAGQPETTGLVLEAALCQSLGGSRAIPGYEKAYTPEVLEAADKRFRGIGIGQLVMMAAVQGGYVQQPGERVRGGNLRDVLRHAVQAAGMSTYSLTGILTNVANKVLLAGYMEEDNNWRKIARIQNVANFYQHTHYRMLDSLEYEQLGPAGEIKHGTLGKESYTSQARTYAKMLGVTREDLINDDLGAFDSLKERLGRGAAKKLNSVFWSAFMDNSSFFTSGRTNYISGGTTNLGTDGVGLGLGVKAVRTMTSPTADGSKRVGAGIIPKFLVHPPELESIAEGLYRNQNLGAVANSSANIYANKYEPVTVWQLSDSSFTGYSTTAWYLLGEPTTAAPVVVSFLNGVETPTVESTDADFDSLALLFRGYHDFGCDQADYLCGVKSKGAA